MEAKRVNNKSRSSTKRILGPSLKMGIATFTSRILGLVREQAMASVFGASAITDAFAVAYRIPNMLRDLFAEGSFSSAFVPTFTEVLQGERENARKLFWSSFVLLFLMTSVISGLIIIFAEQAVQLITDSKFVADAYRFEITATMVKIMAPFLVFISLSALFMGALNALRIFFVPSVAPAFFNVIMISSIVFLTKYFKTQGVDEIYALAWGVLVGGLVQLLIQVPLLLKQGFLPTFDINIWSIHTKKIINRLGIGTVGIAATQINVLITTVLATSTVIGAVSWLNYAFRLFQFPVGILSVSLAGSNLVQFSEAWKKNNKEDAVSLLLSSYNLSFLLIIPCFSLLYAMSDFSVHMIFERGAFLESDRLMTGLALRYYLIGLPFYGIYKIFAPTFFSIDRPKIPIITSIGCIIINLIFCIIFVPKYGFKVLALGTSLTMVLNSFALSFFLKKELNLSYSFFFNTKFFKILISGAICFVATTYINQYFVKSLDVYKYVFLHKALIFCLIGALGVIVYGVALSLMGELYFLRRIIKRNK